MNAAGKSSEAARIALLARGLAKWFEAHRRPLPFRQHYHPYECWLAEVIFQQTRIDQGMPYYRRFLKKYPTIHHLADASAEEVLHLWQGLGYYRRALNLLEGARQVVREYGGRIPADRTALLRIKGIGDYIASALRAIAFNEPDVAVDGNVRRVMSRWFAMPEAVDSAAGTRQIRTRGERFLRHLSPRLFNEAMMEFGALQCTPQPMCETCPLRMHCQAYAEKNPTGYPRRKPRRKPRQMALDFYRITDRKRIWLVQQRGNALWKGLFLFPHYSEGERPPWPRPARPSKVTHHVLTHRRIKATLWDIVVSPSRIETFPIPDGQLVPIAMLSRYPMPRLMDKLLS